MPPVPKILVFDSGLGGLTVFTEVAKLRPHATLLYCADDAGFPYGPLSETALVARVMEVMERLIAELAPDLVVIACNTASTRALPPLRARWPQLPFVGTVPAIKPAAERSRSRLVSVLATPGTVARDYTRALIASFAEDCAVTLIGSTRLAPLAEDFMRGAAVSDAEIAREIAPCFVTREEARTDVVVLACTHYPLLLDFFRRLAPWPVEWIDPAPAIARQADRLLVERFGPDREATAPAPRAIFTSGARPEPALAAALTRMGFSSE
ncbi:glutamate racemase [Methylosinus sp. sav-2]|uniref:glutamate racemase n=1 Tax=Methylosinus sp. sav-2 TaxID=2485168 RepID=UPI00047B9A51|nr:glutamate racemase [Methylosinus sp. sav-2]TDX61472.1 glutamate racemase [Methylosinus sp. sav-2]